MCSGYVRERTHYRRWPLRHGMEMETQARIGARNGSGFARHRQCQSLRDFNAIDCR